MTHVIKLDVKMRFKNFALLLFFSIIRNHHRSLEMSLPNIFVRTISAPTLKTLLMLT